MTPPVADLLGLSDTTHQNSPGGSSRDSLKLFDHAFNKTDCSQASFEADSSKNQRANKGVAKMTEEDKQPHASKDDKPRVSSSSAAAAAATDEKPRTSSSSSAAATAKHANKRSSSTHKKTSTLRPSGRAKGGARAMRKSIMMFEQKLNTRARTSRHHEAPSSRTSRMERIDKKERSSRAKHGLRSLSKSPKEEKSSDTNVAAKKGASSSRDRNEEASNKAAIASALAAAERKSMSNSVGINSNTEGPSLKVLRRSSSLKAIEEKDDIASGSSLKKVYSSRSEKKDDAAPALGVKKQSSRSEKKDDAAPAVGVKQLSRLDKKDDTAPASSVKKQMSRSSGVEALLDHPKSRPNLLRNKSKDDLSLLTKRKPEKNNFAKDTSNIDNSTLGRRFSDDFIKATKAIRPKLRRQSMDESTMELFSSKTTPSTSNSKKPTLKKVPSSSSIKSNEKSDDVLDAFNTWGGRGGKKVSSMKKSFTSSDGGKSLDNKTEKDRDANDKKNKKTKKEPIKKSSARSTASGESTAVKSDKKSFGRKSRPVEIASPVVAPVASSLMYEKKKGIHISRVTLFAVCIMYIISLALVGVLGFWLHMVIFPEENQAHDGVNDNITIVEDESKALAAEFDGPTFSPSSMAPTITAMPTTETRYPTVKPVKNGRPNKNQPDKQQGTATSKNPPADSIPPTVSTSPSITPRPSTLTPTGIPSYTPTTASPTLAPSTVEPTSSQYPSSTPSISPTESAAPSSAPTGIPRCPEKLLKIADLGTDSLITMRYEVVPFPPSDPAGGLFCVSIEYEGNAGWIGFAVSGASRDPAFGRKEAIIGIPGVSTTVAVAPPGSDVAVGQQVGTMVMDGPVLINPGKYEIPAGGGVDGYTGPAIETMLDVERQTLLNSSIIVVGPDDNPLQKATTTMTFTKYLIELDEIPIDPLKKSLFLYAVATIDEDGEYNDNPEWVANYVTLLQTSVTAESRDVKRKRLRHHVDFDTS